MDTRPTVLDETHLSNSFLGRLLQICVVTDDHRRTIEGFVRLGIGPWSIQTVKTSDLRDMTYRGKPASFSAVLCLADTDTLNWEVIEPLEGPSIWRDFLDAHGEGIQHMAFDLGGIPYPDRLRALLDRGYALVQSGTFTGGVAFAYFATEPDAPATIEVYHFPPGATIPAPEAWYPAPPPGAV